MNGQGKPRIWNSFLSLVLWRLLVSPVILAGEAGLSGGKFRPKDFRGRKYPVSRSRTELDGIPCYPSLTDIGEPIDLVIAAIPVAGVRRLLR